MSSSPEVQKKQALKKLELDLKNFRPVIYANSKVDANFAEALRILFVNIRPIEDLLSNTLFTDDHSRNDKFKDRLFNTGFDMESMEILESFKYENRKQGAKMAPDQGKFFENQKRELNKILTNLESPEFIKIDKVLDSLKQFYDLSKFDYIPTLRLFDANFNTSRSYTPSFKSAQPETVTNKLLDLYFVIADFDISYSIGQAIIALMELLQGANATDENKQKLLACLKRIQGVRKQVFTDNILISLIQVGKKDPNYEVPREYYKQNSRKKFADNLKEKFYIDEERIKGELQDERIMDDVMTLFGSTVLTGVIGYNKDLNNELRENTPVDFHYVTAYGVLKTFMVLYYAEGVRNLLNDIIIEGFFTNPAYKTEFSVKVYAVNDTMDRLEAFEKLFDRNMDYDESMILRYIRECHKNMENEKRLKSLISEINDKVKTLIQAEVNNLYTLYELVEEILMEAKKPGSESISNLKMMIMSSKQKGNFEDLENQHEKWNLFFQIMKNYVVVGSIEKR